MKELKLNELKNMAYKLAESYLRFHDEYFCIIDGEKVRVTK